MALTTYLTVNGTIYSQKKSGARTHFIHDALGSVAATVNDGGSVVNKYAYKPFGELLSKTGVGEDPKFLWVGGAGNRTTGRRWAEKYVRRRHYGEQQGMWTTGDPLWPTESAYTYVRGNPISSIDPTGTETAKGCCSHFNLHGKYVPGYVHPELINREYRPCGDLRSALLACGISDCVMCDILGDGECQDAARRFGVDPTVLCGAMINEHAGPTGRGGENFDHCQDTMCWLGVPFGKSFPSPSKISVGCTQLTPRRARECLTKLKKCRPDLHRQLEYVPTMDWGIMRKAADDCRWPLKIAAACMFVETHKECGGQFSPIQWPISWNPGAFPGGGPAGRWPNVPGKGYSARAKCVIAALHKFNPF